MAEPQITVQAVHGGSPNGTIDRIVIHATCPGLGFPGASRAGTARGTADYFGTYSSGGDAHYVHGIRGAIDEQHCMADDRLCWHAPPNPGSVGQELTAEASYTRAEWLSAEVWPILIDGGHRTAELCQRHSVPTRRIGVQDLRNGRWGVCGHVDVSHAWGQSSHWDPGPNFPWDQYMPLVRGISTDTPRPVQIRGPVLAPHQPAPLSRIRQMPAAAWRPGPWPVAAVVNLIVHPDGRPHGSAAVIQRALNGQGCGPLVTDGIPGPRTRAAWRHWESLVYAQSLSDANDVPNASTIRLLGQASQLFIGG